MEPIINPKPDTITVIAEPGALTFATRKEWAELPDDFLDELQHQTITRVFKGKTGIVYFLLYNHNPVNNFSDCGNNNVLVKVVPDEKGNQRFFCMSLSTAETAQLRRNWLKVLD